MSNPFRLDVTNGYSCLIAIKCDGWDLLIPREIRAEKNHWIDSLDAPLFSRLLRISFFLFFFLFLFFPSFFLVPVSPPINVANKNNERPPARTLHPLSVGAHSLVEWRAGEVWFAVRKGRRLLLQTASRQREDTGLCRVSFHVPLSLSLPLSPLYLVIFFLPPRRKKKREKKDDVRSRPSEPRMFKYFRCAKCGCRVKFCVEKFFLHRLNFSFSLHF